MERLSHKMIGRIIEALDPVMVEGIINEYSPLSENIQIVPKIHERVISLFPDLEEYDRVILFVALVYRIYIPASFLSKSTHSTRAHSRQKLPAGIRDLAASCIGYRNSEMVNYFKDHADPFVKNPRFRAKMRIVTDALGLTAPSLTYNYVTEE